MNQAWLSRIPLMTLDMSYRLGEGYVPAEAFAIAARSVRERFPADAVAPRLRALYSGIL